MKTYAVGRGEGLPREATATDTLSLGIKPLIYLSADPWVLGEAADPWVLREAAA